MTVDEQAQQHGALLRIKRMLSESSGELPAVEVGGGEEEGRG